MLDATPQTPTFSISIEWENARFAELDRTRQMLRALREQLIALPPPREPPQINLLYDHTVIDGAMVRRVVEEELQPKTLPAVTKIIPNEGLRYYDQKNYGASISEGELTIFLDSDVIPEAGWLEALIDSFRNPAVGAVAGETYIEYDNFYSKAFALFWFFPLRDTAEDLRETDHFHANNSAFRSEIFAANPFPTLPTFRGQCVALGRALREKGIGLYVQKRARVGHPVPVTLSYFFIRALNNGRDEFILSNVIERRNRPLLRQAYWNYRNGLVASWKKIKNRRKDVGLSVPGAAAAYAVAVLYFTVKAVGETVTYFRPNLISRIFPV